MNSKWCSRLRLVVLLFFGGVLLALFLPLQLSGKLSNALEIGGFVAVVVTLVLLAHGALVQLEETKRSRKPVFWFYIEPEPWLDERDGNELKARTRFKNLSRVPLKMYVSLNPTIYGRKSLPSALGPKYNDLEFVLLGPEGEMRGVLSITKLLEANGETIQRMKEASNPANRNTQLRLSIRIHCKDFEGKNHSVDAKIPYYFDFARGKYGIWVYDG